MISKHIDPNKLIRTGNIIQGPDNWGSINQLDPIQNPFGPSYKILTDPLVHIELRGWVHAKPESYPQTLPNGWKTFGIGCMLDDSKSTTKLDNPPCQKVRLPADSTFWPYNPIIPSNDTLKVGQYVRILGALIVDPAHPGDPMTQFGLDKNKENDIKMGWGDNMFGPLGGIPDCELNKFFKEIIPPPDPCTISCPFIPGAGSTPGINAYSKDYPYYWSEVHPPDLIELLPQKQNTDSVYGLAFLVEVGNTDVIETDLFPPSYNPNGFDKIGFEEFRDNAVSSPLAPASPDQFKGFLLFKSITPDCENKKVHLKIVLKGADRENLIPSKLSRNRGKYKALYRVFWSDKCSNPIHEPTLGGNLNANQQELARLINQLNDLTTRWWQNLNNKPTIKDICNVANRIRELGGTPNLLGISCK